MVNARHENADLFDRFDPAVMLTAIERKRAVIDDYLRAFPSTLINQPANLRSASGKSIVLAK